MSEGCARVDHDRRLRRATLVVVHAHPQRCRRRGRDRVLHTVTAGTEMLLDRQRLACVSMWNCVPDRKSASSEVVGLGLRCEYVTGNGRYVGQRLRTRADGCECLMLFRAS
eukprot:455476-Prymnesium_polylepis.1